MQVWERFLDLLEADLGIETVNKWLRTLKINRFDACNLYLEAKDSFQVLWFEEHIRKLAHEQFVNSNNRRIKIHLVIENTGPSQNRFKAKKAKVVVPTGPPAFVLTFDDTSPHATFDTIVPCENLSLATKILQEVVVDTVSGNSAATYNPIYIYGGKGTAKSHLLMATAQSLRAQKVRVLYVRAETFTEHVVSAIRAGEMSQFRQAYRHVDVLIVDDVHVFSRKGATQEEFFHTFNSLHVAGKQIILSANCAPNELQLIEPRLVSRFEWGIVIAITPIEKEELLQVLKVKMRVHDFPLSQKVTEFLMETFGSTTSSIVKALDALILRVHMRPEANKFPTTSLSVPFVKTLLSDLVTEAESAAVTPERIIQAVAEYFGIKQDDILGKAQTRSCVIPRQIAMHLCRAKLNLPYMRIGELFARDHSTVMTSVKQIQKGIDEDKSDVAGPWGSISNQLRG